MSLINSEGITKVDDENILYAKLLKAVFPLPEEFNIIVLLRQKFGGSTPQL